MADSGALEGLFVAGTDTGVGKTVIAAGLTGWLRETGIDARAIKPAQTGIPQDDDARKVADVCGDTDASTCLRRLEPALAPRVAAAETETDLSYESILEDTRKAAVESEFAIVEGIGGVRVPLAGDREVIDLAADLGYPALVVARSGLGTLNHTALTAEALNERDIPIEGVILNTFEGTTAAERTNPNELERMTGHEVVTVPPLETEKAGAIVDDIRKNVPASILPVSVSEEIS